MRHRRLVDALFRVMVVALPAAWLYGELSGKAQLAEMSDAFFVRLAEANPAYLLACVLLALLNCFCEVQKWRCLLAPFEQMPFKRALKATLAGASFALFTPNRLGDYAGRVLFVRPENRLKTLCATAVGNFAQLLALLAGGSVGAVFFAARVLQWPYSRLAALCAVAGIAGLAGLYVYFNMRLLSGLLLRIPLTERMPSVLAGIRAAAETDRRNLFQVLAWAFARYAVYSLQYLLLLYFFGIETGIAMGLSGIATIYLLQTVVPLPAIAGLAVRGGLAVFVWSHFGANTIASLAASFVLWIINLILPALLGTFSLFSVHITKLTGYDDD
jgi:hypothetical protein